jgi:hypothetical protein
VRAKKNSGVFLLGFAYKRAHSGCLERHMKNPNKIRSRTIHTLFAMMLLAGMGLQPAKAEAKAGGANGGCAAGVGGNCNINEGVDTHQIYASPSDGGQLVEFSTYNGGYYKRVLATNAVVAGTIGDANTAPWASVNGQFDTRAVYVSTWDNNNTVEFITTTTGKYYKFVLNSNGTRTLSASGTLGDSNTARWSAPNGPCSGVSPCRFDSRVVHNDIWANNAQVEFITVGRVYWKYRLSDNALLLKGTLGDAQTSRYSANGPCTGIALSTCWIDSRTVYTQNGVQYEIVLTHNKWWKYQMNTLQLVATGNLNLSPIPWLGP